MNRLVGLAATVGSCLIVLACAAQDTPSGLVISQAQPSDTAARCQALMELDRPGIEITSVKVVPAAAAGTVPYSPFTEVTIPAAFPEHCRVEGMINRRSGADGVEYGIGFALALPSNWNGRLLFSGGGGFNGTVADPHGIGRSPTNPALTRGFAVITTDSGHKGQRFDVTFMRDQQAALDFAFNAVPTVTQTGKDLAAAYFARAPHHTYSDGCSTGGREGMLGAQRYPSLFDGVVAGAPAMRTAHTRLAGWNATVAFNRIAPRDAEGQPLRLQVFPVDDQELLSAAVAEQCDALDGLMDGMILNIAACKFDPAVLQCTGRKNATCLSAEQVSALKTAFGETRDSAGNTVYPGFAYDLGLLGEHVGNTESRLPMSAPGPYDSPPSPLSADFASDIARLRADPLQTLSDTFNWTDLGTFYRRGGKIIFYHGASDPWFSIFDTLDYMERNKQANPDFDSSRLYSVPNMSHCGGGGLERFDMLTALVDWVENGKAPGAITATDSRGQIGTRPLCPWPQYAHYNGTGDPKDAGSFECRVDSQ